MKFFTPPYETVQSLKVRLEGMYADVQLGNVKSIAWFVCRKAERAKRWRKDTMSEKITLSGVPETMLQTVYARAKETKTRGAITDNKASRSSTGSTTIFRWPTRTRRCTAAL